MKNGGNIIKRKQIAKTEICYVFLCCVSEHESVTLKNVLLLYLREIVLEFFFFLS